MWEQRRTKNLPLHYSWVCFISYLYCIELLVLANIQCISLRIKFAFKSENCAGEVSTFYRKLLLHQLQLECV